MGSLYETMDLSDVAVARCTDCIVCYVLCRNRCVLCIYQVQLDGSWRCQEEEASLVDLKPHERQHDTIR